MSQGPMEKKNFLCVGLICVDIMNHVEKFPTEDSDNRASDQYWQRGGNASNNCTVLSLLGENVSIFGTIANSNELGFLQDDFKKYNISFNNCPIKENVTCPLSIAIVNKQNGSRTIIHHNRNLPELTSDEFSKLDLKNFDWIHFEGRPSVDEISGMLQIIDTFNEKYDKKIRTSVELEKKRETLKLLADRADVIFVSKGHASMLGYNKKEDALLHYLKKCRPKATVIVPWAEEGAVGQVQGQDQMFHSPCFSPDKVIDTLGAGDTFVASCIQALSRDLPLAHALKIACKVAGFKCGIKGYDGISKNLIV
ncbi:DgyrCDS8977 [Dimorphilus gyrociliatus]|uniref:DgyrCDS8977 n=1 Tax=Dimorphilus gyrociliatus TaxID=2664684 RepID=A0A7I8VVP9_9ANNE|nr:DgyrCDS8977 [Dimorphilus gyrociliatus]